MTTQTQDSFNYTKRLLIIIGGVLLFRLFILFNSPLGLHGDEAQYWAWSTDLDWGYFTKPPLIAWMIATSTNLFGHEEWAIRLPSSLIHCITTWILFLTGRMAFDARTGFWAACVYFLMPAVWLSSTIISTDVPLLLCWALALNAWVALRQSPSWSRAVQLGLAVGFGLLAKYAMMFFIPVFVLAAIFDKPTRRVVLGLKGFFIVMLAGVIFTPNILWNLNHDFATLSHTADNASLNSELFNIDELASFLIDQLGVFGPLSFPLLIIALWKFRTLPPFARWLALLMLTPLTVISAGAFISRANANWAVTAYIGGALLIAIFAVHRAKILQVLKYGLIGQSLLMAAAGLIILSPTLTDAFGLSNSVKRLRAWPETMNVIKAKYETGHNGLAFEAIATDKRLIFYQKTYHNLRDTAPFYMWKLAATPANHAELTYPLPAMKGPILLVNYEESYERFFREDFGRLEPMSPIKIDLGGGKFRELKVWAGYDYTPTKEIRINTPLAVAEEAP
jgi:4-amino-4-deoxy-L-arabinose transferase-like glycosyltransferase